MVHSSRLWWRAAALRKRQTLGWLALLAVAFCLLGWATLYGPLQQFDLSFSREVQETSGRPWDQLMIAASFLGNALTLIPVALVSAIYLWARGLRNMAVFMAVTPLSLLVDVAQKFAWDRARPNVNLVHVLLPRAGPSFPSGHAVGSTAVYGFMAFLVWVHLSDNRLRAPVALLLAGVPILVSFSRIYVGAHWLSDVVGGVIIGMFCLIFLSALYRAKRDESQKAAEIGSDPTTVGTGHTANPLGPH